MRTAFILFILLVTLPTAALADAGHQADLNMVMDFGDLLAQFGTLMQVEGSDGTGGDSAELDSKMEMNGQMFWTEDFMRVDLEPIEGTNESTIIDLKNMVTYRLDHNNKQATRIDSTEFDAEAMTGLDMPDPETMASDWHGFLDALNDVEGAVVNELAPRQISGYDCKGFSFVVALPQPEATGEAAAEGEDEEMAAMMGAMMGVLGGYSGEIWVAEDIAMPLSMTINTMMMNLSWGLSNIVATDLADSRFAVPDDYEIVEMQLPDMSEMPDFSETQAPQPVPEG